MDNSFCSTKRNSDKRIKCIYVSQSQRKVYVSYMGGPVFQTRQTPNAPPLATAAK